MSVALSILAAIVGAVVIIGGVLVVALKLSDRNRTPDPRSQGDTGSGGYDGYSGGADGGGD